MLMRGSLPGNIFGGRIGLSGRPAARRLAASGEPSIDRATSLLSAPEADEYKRWESLQKTLFLMAYQWLAVSSAKGLTKLDGGAFTGALEEGAGKALESLKIAGKYSKNFSPAALAEFNEATVVLKEASTKTIPAIQKAVDKFRPLRDRVAWELGASKEVVAYEVVGDDPESPGTIYTKTVGGEGSPDVDAVFSNMSPKVLVANAEDLEGAFEALGVPFRRSDLSGANLGDVGSMPILAYFITLVVSAITFYYLYNRAIEGGKVADAVRAAIAADSSLSPDEKLAVLAKFNAGDSFFSTIFGSTFSWTHVIVGATIFGIAFFVLPKILHDRPWEKKLVRA
jgi:hypothetical protein